MNEYAGTRCDVHEPGAGHTYERERLIGKGARVRTGMILLVTLLAWAAPARGQSPSPTDGDAPDGVADSPSEAAGALPLAGDDAVSAAGAPDAPWNQGENLAQRRAAARAVFREANDLARKRFHASATAKYKQAIELWPHPAFSYNLAVAQQQLDQLVEAHANLERALAHGPEHLAGRDTEARQQIARIESELSPIEVTCAEPGAEVMLDGKGLFTAPGAHRGVVRPGAHQLVATRHGLPNVVEQIVTSPGERSRFVVRFEYPVVEDRVRRWAGWKSYAVAGTGAALLLAGAALDWHSTRVFDEYDRRFLEACANDVCTPAMESPALAQRRSRGESEQRLAVIGYAAGGVALATGVALTYLGRERVVHRRAGVTPGEESAQASNAITGSITPVIAPSVIGVRAGFRF